MSIRLKQVCALGSDDEHASTNTNVNGRTELESLFVAPEHLVEMRKSSRIYDAMRSDKNVISDDRSKIFTRVLSPLNFSAPKFFVENPFNQKNFRRK